MTSECKALEWDCGACVACCCEHGRCSFFFLLWDWAQAQGRCLSWPLSVSTSLWATVCGASWTSQRSRMEPGCALVDTLPSHVPSWVMFNAISAAKYPELVERSFTRPFSGVWRTFRGSSATSGRQEPAPDWRLTGVSCRNSRLASGTSPEEMETGRTPRASFLHISKCMCIPKGVQYQVGTLGGWKRKWLALLICLPKSRSGRGRCCPGVHAAMVCSRKIVICCSNCVTQAQ